MSDIKSVNIRGLLDSYEFSCKLPGSGEELKIKPITTGQMKKILMYEDETDPYVVEDVLDKLMSECVITDGFDIKSLYLQDRFSLLLELRKITKGDSYQFKCRCPKCKVENINSVLISELKSVPREDVDNIIVINDNLSFEVDFPTRGDQLDATNRYRKSQMNWREKQVNIQTGTFANSVKRVHTPEGVFDNIPYEDKVYILDNINSDIFDKFTQWFSDNSFGVEFKFDITCFHCAHNTTMEIPLSDFFI